MARALTRTWYRIALAVPAGGAVLVAAQGEHLGVAVAVAERHVRGSYAVAAEVAIGDGIPLGESVGKHHIVELGDVADVPMFRWPSGVLPALGLTTGVLEARRGWTLHPDPALLVIEAQTDAEHLVDLFLGMIERLPSADNLEIRVLDHFEGGSTTDVWLTSRLNAKRILRFLDDHDVEILANGHLEVSVYVRAHKATLRLTEHKTVVWIAEGAALEAEVTRWLKELGVPRVERLVRLVDAPHFHYRPANTRDRKKLAQELYRQRLRRVDSIVAARPGADTAG